MKQEDPTVRLEIRDFSRAEKANGDVVARARELMRDVEGYGDWILEPNEDSNGAYHVHSSSGSCIAEFSDRGDARFAANARMLVPELIEYALDEHAAADHWHVLWQQNVETASAAMRERDAANAEVEKLRRGGKELGRIIERQCRDVLNITGLHHLIDPDGDGDWGLVWERLAEMAAAGAEVEKLRAALETIHYTAKLAAIGAHAVGHASKERLCLDILDVIERAGIEP